MIVTVDGFRRQILQDGQTIIGHQKGAGTRRGAGHGVAHQRHHGGPGRHVCDVVGGVGRELLPLRAKRDIGRIFTDPAVVVADIDEVDMVDGTTRMPENSIAGTAGI